MGGKIEGGREKLEREGGGGGGGGKERVNGPEVRPGKEIKKK